MAFVDESGKRFSGRFLLPEEILPWLQAQKKPSWAKYFCTHHTWSPTQDKWSGLSTLKGIFNYYKNTRGWPDGMGPHFWVAPREKGGPLGVWIGTHPYHKGIGAIDWNSDTLHCEYAWNGDLKAFDARTLSVGKALIDAIQAWIGIPNTPVNFSGNWAVKGKSGHLFHRDTPKANKTCPGSKNTHKLVWEVYQGTPTPIVSSAVLDVDLTKLPSGYTVKKTLIKVTRPYTRNHDVTWVQMQLKGIKIFPDLKVDGIYGPRTEQGIKIFQKAKGLQIDGIVGPKTWAALVTS